jgi:hypothetical protein
MTDDAILAADVPHDRRRDPRSGGDIMTDDAILAAEEAS